MIKNISCVMIAHNAQETLPLVLKSLQEFEEVVIYSNNSSDETENIASSFSNVTLVVGKFLGFGPTKNRAVSLAKNDWVLSLDADEVLSVDFINNLKNIHLDDRNVYTIDRVNYYKEREIKHCWGNDIIVRLFNREKTSFTDKKVHEKISDEDFNKVPLKGVVKHYPYSNVTDFIIKLDRYSTIYAQDNAGKKSSSPTKAFLNSLFSFIKTYFFKRGFLDGYAGLIIAFSHMATNFYKYIKLYEKNLELKKN